MIPRKLSLLGPVLLALLAPTTAHAAIEPLGNFGATEIKLPGATAVNESTNNIYVDEIEGAEVLEYKPTATSAELALTFGGHVNKTKVEEKEKGATVTEQEENICTVESHDQCQEATTGSSPGEFGVLSGVAIDQGTGDVYVADSGNERIEKFNEKGEYLSQIDSGTNGNPIFYLPPYNKSDIAVDSAGNLLALDWEDEGKEQQPGRVLQFSPAGAPTEISYGPALSGTEKLTRSTSVAVDGQGDVYVGREKQAIVEFSPMGGVFGELEGSINSRFVTVDPRTGDVFVVSPEGHVGEVVEYEGRGRHAGEYLHEGKQIASFGPVIRSYGLAYDVAEGKLYVSDEGFGWVSVFGGFPTPPVQAPGVESESFSGISQHTVTLAAQINPNGDETTYEFKYATNPTLENPQTVTGNPSESPKNVFTAQLITAAVTDLRPDTLYYYRALATSVFEGGKTVEGPIQSFTTPAEPASAATGAASSLTQDSALLSGAVTPGSEGPNADTKWCFQYGTTTAYEGGWAPLTPGDAGQGATPAPVSVQLEGLWPDTLYHYRLVAVNSLGLGLGTAVCGTAGGVETDGSDQTFSTTLPPPPSVTTGAAGGVGESGATITGSVDPHGVQSTYEFDIGTDTSYGARIFGNAHATTGPEPFAATLQNLQPATTYHYRLVATNAYGTTYGADQTFTTAAVPAALITAPPTPPLIATQVVRFPGEVKTGGTVTKTVTTKKRCKKGTKLEHGRCVRVKAKAKSRRKGGAQR